MLTINETQFVALRDSTSALFLDRAVSMVDEHFMDFFAIYGDAGVRKRIDVDLQRARFAGLAAERALMQYLYLSLTLGNGFDLDSRFSWLALNPPTAGVSADERIDRAMEAYVDRLERGLPLEDTTI
jgi:hypothetical protein